MTGCLVPSASLIIKFTTPSDNAAPPEFSAKLCIPEEDAESSMWSVPPPSLNQAKGMFDFEASELGFTGADDQALWNSLVSGSESKTVHVLSTGTDDTYPSFPEWMTTSLGKSDIQVTSDHLQRAFHYARLIKTDEEISYIREACRITSGAHEVVMRELGKFAKRRQGEASDVGRRDGKEGLSEWEIESEGDAEAVFVAACRRAGYVSFSTGKDVQLTPLFQCGPSLLANRRIRKPCKYTTLRMQRPNLSDIPPPSRFHINIHPFSTTKRMLRRHSRRIIQRSPKGPVLASGSVARCGVRVPGRICI